MDFLFILAIVVGVYFLTQLISRASDEIKLEELKERLEQTVIVNVERHVHKEKTVFLMFYLLDDKFIAQAPTAAELVAIAKKKFPGKLILVNGSDEIQAMPEFNPQ